MTYTLLSKSAYQSVYQGVYQRGVDDGRGKALRGVGEAVAVWFQARFRVYVTGEDGTKSVRQVYRPIDASTMTEAKRNLAGVRQRLGDEIEREYLIDDAYPGSSTVLYDYMGRYIDEREAAGAIEPTTAANYRNSAKHVMRHLPGGHRAGRCDHPEGEE